MMDILRLYRSVFECRLVFYLRGHLATLRTNLREDSFFPERERKSYPVRLADNIRWYILHGEINPYYNSYGFDVKGLRDQRRYLAYRRFRIERNNGNLALSSAYGYNYICVLRDKVLFSSYMAGVLGARYVPENIGRLLPDGTVHRFGAEHAPAPLHEILAAESGDLFIKKLNGQCGEGCFLLENAAERDLVVNGEPMTVEEFLRHTAGSEFVVQRRISQHEALEKLNPSCLNTVRIVTILGRSGGRPVIFGQFLRLGVDSVMDNRAAGGIAVRIDDGGVLRGDGFGHHFRCRAHPVTGEIFDGRPIPFWTDIQQLVFKAHDALRDIPAIGWDVAVTPTGPLLIEGNDNWELCGFQDTAGGMKERWRRLRNA